MSENQPSIVELDRDQLHVLAHPLRNRLLGELRLAGPATATALAGRLSTNSGATSYHLRRLATVGLVVEDADRGRGRERWWRSAHDATTWTPTQFDAEPDDRAAADWLRGQHLRMSAERIERWLATRHEWSEAWRAVADQSDYQIPLDAEQTKALVDELHEVIERHRSRAASDAAEGGDAPVAIIINVFPTPTP